MNLEIWGCQHCLTRMGTECHVLANEEQVYGSDLTDHLIIFSDMVSFGTGASSVGFLSLSPILENNARKATK